MNAGSWQSRYSPRFAYSQAAQEKRRAAFLNGYNRV